MSRTVENRVVEMQFQNKQFEEAVAQSRQSIQLLEKDLKLLEGVQALKNLDNAISNVDFSGMQDGLNVLKDRFSTLGIISMTVIQNITNGITSTLLGALHSAGESITGLFRTIYDKGLTRAQNIEQANFALQGLLSTEYKIEDANGELVADMDTVKSKMADISEVIDKAVSGTAYSYDQAAKVASTLAASYGTSAEGISGIGNALKSIVGMAGQTGQDFDTVARVFTKVAASGKAMSMEINSVSAWGVGATAMIAKFINNDNALKKQMNNSLKTKKNYRSALQEITEADIYELASKGKITSDLFIKVFEPFFDNAQKANDTLSGVTANIGAALGRLGVSFIQPIMQNEGPLVKFLQTVRQKIVDVKNAIEELHIPQNFTETVTNFLERVTELLESFDVSKLEIFGKIANAMNVIHDAFTIQDAKEISWDDTYGVNLDKGKEYYDKYVKLKPLEVFSKVFDFGVSDVSQRRSTDKELEYLNYAYNAINKSYTKWQQAHSEGKLISPFQYLYDYNGNLVKVNVVDAMNAYNDLIEQEERGSDSWKAMINQIHDASYRDADLAKDRDSIFSYNYLQNLYDGLGNIASAFANIKEIFNDLFTSVGGPVKIIWDLITGNTADNSPAIRIFINDLSESFLNLTERVKDFTENNESFRDILKAIGNIFLFIGDAGSAVWQILKNAFVSFTPLLERIFDFIGKIASVINDVSDYGQENDVWTDIINTLSTAIDWLAQALTFAWDVAVGFLGIFAPSDIEGTLGKFYDIICVIGSYIGANLPVWIEKAKPYIEWFIEKVQEAAEFLKEKLGVAIDWLSPYFDSFVGWLSDLTDGAVDLSEPMGEINDILGTTSEVTENVSGAIEDISNSVGAVTGGHLLGAPTKMLGSLIDTLDILGEKRGVLGLFSDEVSEDGEKVVKPWEKFKNTVETIYNTVKDWFKKRLDDFGILEDGEKVTDAIGDFIDKIKSWIGNIDIDKVMSFIGNIIKLASGAFITFSAGTSTMNFSKAISKLPDMFMNISSTIQSFSPFYADVMKADNKTTRRQALADIIKSFALVIGAVALAFLAFGYAMEKIGSLNDDQFKRAASAMAVMGAALIVLIVALLGVMAIFISNTKTKTTVTNNPIVQKIGGIKDLYGFLRNGQLYDQTKTVTDNGSNAWKSMAAIGAVIGAFALSVAVISTAIWALGNMDSDKLDQGIVAFMEIAGVIVVLMILLGAFAYLLSGSSGSSSKQSDESLVDLQGGKGKGWIKGASKSNKKWKQGSGDWKVLAAMGVAIALIAGAMTGIIWAISLVSNIPMAHIDKGLEVFAAVANVIIGLVAVVGLVAIGITAFNKNTKKGMTGPLIALGVILGILIAAIGGLLILITEIAILPIRSIENALALFEYVGGAIIGLVATIGIFMVALSLITVLSKKGEHVSNTLATAAVLIGAIAVMFLAIGGAFFLIGSAVGIIAAAFYNLDESTIGKIVAILGIITGLVVGVMICVTVMTGLMKNTNNAGATLGLVALLSVLMISLASIFAAIGLMAKMIGESGMSVSAVGEIVGMIQTIVIVITAISLIITILMAFGIGEGILGVIATISTMFAALAVLFVGIGVAAVLVGTGVNLIIDSLMKLINFFGEDDTEAKVKKTQSGLMMFMTGLGALLFTGLIGIATFLDNNKEKVVDSIAKIVAFILEAIWAAFVQTFQTNLEGLTQIIEMIDIWLNRNKFEIERIITNLTDIIFSAINAFADNMMRLIFGDDYSGDTSGLLGQLTTALIGWFRTHFIDEGADGRTLLRDTMNVIGEEAHQGILDFLTFIQNSQDIPAQALDTVDSVICSIGNALVEKGPAIIDHVKNLMKLVWELIKYGLGIRKTPPDASEFQFTPGEAGDPEGVMGDVSDSMGDGLISSDWTSAVNEFMSKFWNAMTKVIFYGIPGVGLLWDLGQMIGQKITEGTHEGLDNGSPSRAMEQEGIWAMEGLYNGLTNRRVNRDINEASIDIARRTVNIVSDGMEAIGDATSPFIKGLKWNLTKLGRTMSLMMSGMLDGIEAKISPYLDLTQIEEGFGSIQDMMSGNSEFDITSLTDSNAFASLSENATSSEGAGDIATDFDEANMPDLSGMNEMLNPETIVNFTQNNYSPEALSRIDIYRDTKNMLSNKSILQNLIPSQSG